MSNLDKQLLIQSKIKKIHQLIKKDPNNASLFNSLGIVYEKSGMVQKAMQSYKEAIRRDIGFLKAYNNIGAILYRQKRYHKSVLIFEMALKQNPKDTQTLCNIGAACNRAKEYERAREYLEYAIKLNPQSAGAYVNIGNVYNKLDMHKKALKAHKKALSFDDKSATNHANIAITYKNLGESKKAIKEFKKAISLEPDFVNAHFDLATTYLSIGDFENGFREYEWRFKKDELKALYLKESYIFKKPKFSLDLPTDGKNLLLYSEQGFGDMIQFIRYAKILKDRFKKLNIIVSCRSELMELFSNLEFIDRVIDRDIGIDVDEFDYQYAIMSLPYLLSLKKSKTPNKRYIKADSKMDLNLDMNKLNIGLVWGGSVTGESYPKKIFSPRDFQALMDNKYIDLYSLQVGEDTKAIKELDISEDEMIDLSPRLSNFYKTAQAIKSLDLVITSDTSVAHLAGAMGKSVWILLLKKPDWRWELDSDTTIWYPSAKLFRQKVDGDWSSVFKEIHENLNKKYGIDLKVDK